MVWGMPVWERVIRKRKGGMGKNGVDRAKSGKGNGNAGIRMV